MTERLKLIFNLDTIKPALFSLVIKFMKITLIGLIMNF